MEPDETTPQSTHDETSQPPEADSTDETDQHDEQAPGDDESPAAESSSELSRRTALKAGMSALAAALGLAGLSGTGAAQSPNDHTHLGQMWQGTSPTNFGLRIRVPEQYGLISQSTQTTGQTFGVHGISQSPNVNSAGVKGTSTSNAAGVRGNATDSGRGVYGTATTNTAVRGNSTSGQGVYGTSSENIGVEGESTNNLGVRGRSTNATGVVGVAAGGGFGVFAANTSDSPSTTALFSNGHATILGNLNVSGVKNFVETVETPEGKKTSYTPQWRHRTSGPSLAVSLHSKTGKQ